MIELRRVSKRYDGASAVSDVSFAVAGSEFVAIIGESGSGKTTMLNMVDRLTSPSAGEILIDARNIADVNATTFRRQIGFVFQEVGLFPHLSVAENIAITPRLLGWSKSDIAQRVQELLGLVRLDPMLAARMPAQLSGGQQQRVGLARALAARPRIMLMDEPFGALDPLIRDELAGEYRAIHDKLGLTTVLVTHDMTEALLLADRIGVMREGRLLQIAPVRELLDAPANDYVRTLLDTPRQRARRLAETLRDSA
jgi:osmoprotectant transport system ATP-binding protein